MDRFLSCDWGTSAFRLRLVRASDLRVLAETSVGAGIADTHGRWQRSAQDAGSRTAFYAADIGTAITALSDKVGATLGGVPVVLSGMASSSIGMVELPYKEMPFALDGTDLRVEALTAEGVDNPILIVSGASTANDAMRGEETKVLGCSSISACGSDPELLIFPGTHPKHVTIVDNQATALITHMTGEFFKLLSTHSVLASSVKEGADFSDPGSQYWFGQGVDAGAEVGVLQGAFRVRTNQLLQNVADTHNFHFLSGLLIGTELASVDGAAPVYLIAGKKHEALYRAAFKRLGIPLAGAMDADEALIRGQLMLLMGR